jgi:inositol transport system ATP-binding protein
LAQNRCERVTAGTNSPAVLQARGLGKVFPGVRALDDVSLTLRRGRVHALVGENGAGKSTLLRILAGLETPDAGDILFQGRPVRLRNPHQALRLGISMVHQELMSFPHLSVAENLFMGQEPASRWLGRIDKRRLRTDTRQLLQRLGVELDPAQPLRDLRVAEMQTVEIARALAHRAEVLLMDEPTSALSDREVARLVAVIRDLTRQGVAVLFISHKLEEVFRLADTVTVLRDGCHVATRAIGEVDRNQLIGLMVGRAFSGKTRRAAASPGEVVLAVRGLSKAGRFREVHLELRRGEVVGLAGLMGAGRTDVVNALYGLAPADAGEIRVRGRPARIRSPGDALARGIAWIGEDRKESGLIPRLSVKHNVTLASLARCCRRGFIRRREESRLAEEQIRALGIKTPDANRPVDLLSGGNQQKVVLARALLTGPDILLLDEPTRGIDIAAKAEVHNLIARLVADGKAVLLVSSELPELFALSDRILVMRQGTVTARLDTRATTPEEVMRHAMPVNGAGG